MHRFAKENEIGARIFLSFYCVKVEKAVKNLREREQVDIFVIFLIFYEQFEQIVNLVHILCLWEWWFVIHFLLGF